MNPELTKSQMMNPVEDLYHTILQKLIILMLGLMTVGVFLSSCTMQNKACSAYNDVEVNKEITESCE